jgi:DNA-binding response OmpR family regulator
MNSRPKILLIDSASDRKQRINALKSRGYAVFPALKMEEARSRCMRGGYDLIGVNAGDEQEKATQYCDDIRHQCPNQQVLMYNADGSGRDYAVRSDVQSLLSAVDSALITKAIPADLASAA